MADKKNTSHDLEAGWIKELASILEETGLTEIEIEKNDIRLRVARQGAPVAVAPPAANYTSSAEAAPAEAPATKAPVAHPGTVKSPMVGTAYLAPSPGSPNFVKVGDSVSEGQTVMIVEAMKTMNPITAPRAGKVDAILVSDSQPVEFDDALLIID